MHAACARRSQRRARARRDDELLELAAVRRAVDSDAHPSLSGLRHTLATFPHAVYVLARL